MIVAALFAAALAAEPYTWDLSHIFADVAAFEKAVADAEADISKLAACEGTLGQSANQLADTASTTGLRATLWWSSRACI